eukprot:102846-Alexandrium_andersonii.AAC.1
MPLWKADQRPETNISATVDSKIASARSFELPNVQNCMRRSELELRGPGTAPNLVPEAPEGCVPRRCSRRFRI